MQIKISEIEACRVDIHSPILDSLKINYSGFDTWLLKCAHERRPTLVYSPVPGTVTALAILKVESEGLNCQGDVCKICTFKVDDLWCGRGIGSALLDMACTLAGELGCEAVYLELLPQSIGLHTFLERRGFSRFAILEDGQMVFSKAIKRYCAA